MNSMAPSLVSHSALLTQRAGVLLLWKSRKRAAAIESLDVGFDLLGREQLTLDRLCRSGRRSFQFHRRRPQSEDAEALQPREAENRQQAANMETRGVGSKPM
jgi:hypothetical protein